jgi:hypothetical protein
MIYGIALALCRFALVAVIVAASCLLTEVTLRATRRRQFTAIVGDCQRLAIPVDARSASGSAAKETWHGQDQGQHETVHYNTASGRILQQQNETRRTNKIEMQPEA